MGRSELYDSAIFDMMVHQVLCTVVLTYDAIEFRKYQGLDDPFDIEVKGEFKVVKKLYRDIYDPRYVPADEVNAAVECALKLYHSGCRP